MAAVRYLEDYLIWLEHGRSVSEHTLKAYRTDLGRFATYLGTESAREPTALRTADLKDYVAELLESGLKRSTIARHVAALRGYFRYLLMEGAADDDPAASLRTPRRRRSLPRVLSTEQMERLLQAPAGSGFLAVRDRALLEVLYSAGLRVSELVGLDVDDLDLARGWARVLGKGRQERDAVLGSHAVEATRAYLDLRESRRRTPDERALFLNHRGTRLTDRSVRRVLERHLVRADVPPGVTPHTLRHTFATHLLAHGAGLKEVQELLGHKHLSSTQVYTHVSPEHLRRAYETAHPRAEVAAAPPRPR